MRTNEIGLTPHEIKTFKEKGFVRLKKAFSPNDAQQARELLWPKLEYSKRILQNRPNTWKEWQGISEHYSTGLPWSHILSSPRLVRSIDQLCGEGKWEPFGLGWWPITFPCQPPWGASGPWHINGANFTHHINLRLSGLSPLFCFSNIQPTCGGPVLCVGSHKIVSQVLMESEPQGLKGWELTQKVLARMKSSGEGMQLEEVHGKEGDVMLLHPFLLHAQGKNLGENGDEKAVRFMCNPNVKLKENMSFPRDPKLFDEHVHEEYSPVEQAIVNALL